MKIIQTENFNKWLLSLKDEKVKAIIASRIERLSLGLKGDIKPLGQGLSELRVHFGAGFRIYLMYKNNKLIILLGGGSKKTQSTDVRNAKRLAKYLEKNND